MAEQKKTKFEVAVIANVTAIRTQKGLSQYDIASILGLSSGFIGQIETPNNASKYNLNHLNKLADAMGCSVKDFMPEKPIKEDYWEE